MNFENHLNNEQLMAVSAPDRPSLVIAAAGTGKTRTLIYRLAWLVSEKNVDPSEVLLLTFTNKAADEMLSRAEELVNKQFNKGFSGTFHSFANRILRQHAEHIGFGRDFSILDTDDAKKLMRSCIDELGIDKKSFPKPEVLLSLFGVVSGQQGDLISAIEKRFEYADVTPDDIVKIHALYGKKKLAANAIDFDDLLIFAHKIFSENQKIREFYQQSFKYVLVDEYQDTNLLQAAIVNLSQNLASEWALSGVRVNCIRPGFFPTQWNKENFITKEREQAILSHTPMRRYGDPSELLGAAHYLASDASSFVTGSEVVVDGGFSSMTI